MPIYSVRIFAFFAAMGPACEVRASPMAILPEVHLQAGEARPPEEIVVTSRRLEPMGSVEREFNEDDITANGADSIGELLGNLQPFIDPSGRAPIILINGRPAGFDKSIDAYPVEALNKITVLSAGEARQYGAQARERVINLVLKPKFASLDLNISYNAATMGGQHGGSVSLSRSVVTGDTRWTARVQANAQSALLRSEREIPIQSVIIEQTADIVGAATALHSWQGPQGAAMASRLNPGDFETLQPSSRNVTAGISVARPLGRLSAAMNLDGSYNYTHGLRGLPRINLVRSNLPSAYDGPTVLFGRSPLRSDNSVRAISGTLTLSGLINSVQTNLSASFSNTRGRDLFDAIPAMESLRWSMNSTQDMFYQAPLFTRSSIITQITRTQSSNAILRLNLQKAAVQLPAGLVSWSFSANAIEGRSFFKQDGSSQISRRSRYKQSGMQASVGIPLSSDGSEMDLVGDLSIDLSVARQSADGRNAQMSYGAAVTWAPISKIQLRGSIDRSQDTPNLDQLNAPLIVVQDHIFDYYTKQFSQVAKTTGGNPSLGRGRQTSASLSLQAKPFSRYDAALDVTYRQLVAANSITVFPDLNPSIEIAFPERIVRDSSGVIIALDARAINMWRQNNATLSSNFTLRLTDLDSLIKPLPKMIDGIRIDLSVGYQMNIESRSYIKRGLPVIDHLTDTGTSRHQVQFRVSAGTRAFTGSINASWRSAAVIAAETERFYITPPAPINFSLSIRLDRLSDKLRESHFARDTKITFNVQNMFRSYRRIKLANGTIPIENTRYHVDPMGRTIFINLSRRL